VLKVITLFSCVWPFLAMASVRRRERSCAPIVAGLVALSVILCGVWVELSNGIGLPARGTIRTGSFLAVWPIGWIAILSLALRHRPVADRVVLALAALWCASAATAWHFDAFLTPSTGYVLFARVAAAVTLAIAIAAAVRLFLVTHAPKNLEARADYALDESPDDRMKSRNA
jgi:hypothetical protein